MSRRERRAEQAAEAERARRESAQLEQERTQAEYHKFLGKSSEELTQMAVKAFFTGNGSFASGWAEGAAAYYAKAAALTGFAAFAYLREANEAPTSDVPHV